MWWHCRANWWHLRFANRGQPRWRNRWWGTRQGRGTKARTRIDCQSQSPCIPGCRMAHFASKRGSRMKSFEAFSKTGLNFRAFHWLQGFISLDIESELLVCLVGVALKLAHNSELRLHRWVKGLLLWWASGPFEMYLYGQLFYYACYLMQSIYFYCLK